MLTNTEGETAVHLARDTIEKLLKDEEFMDPSDLDLPEIFNEKRGVFVTLTKDGLLRGCIGHPYPDSRLVHAIIDSAISAATRDPRFPLVQPSEIGDIAIEVTVLTQPELIDATPEELPEKIEIGRHGLIVKDGYCQGLLLPQVAPEHGMDEVDFLCHTCLKAGLSPDAWKEGVEVYCFEGQIFKETAPGANVVEESFEDMSCK